MSDSTVPDVPNNVPNEEENAAAMTSEAEKQGVSDREFLWALLDDIDTVSDMVKGDDKAYRRLVEKIQRKRWEMSTSDGYKVFFAPNKIGNDA